MAKALADALASRLRAKAACFGKRCGMIMIPFQGAQKAFDAAEQRQIEIAGNTLRDSIDALIESGVMFPGGAVRQAFVSLVTPDYRWGALAWLRSLRRYSQRTVILLVAREIALPDDLVSNVFQLQVPELYHQHYQHKRPEFRHTLSKLWVFALTCIDRIAFVDIDCIFLGDVEALFTSERFMVTPDHAMDETSAEFNSGVFAFSPNTHLRRKLFLALAEAESPEGGDQGALNSIFKGDVTFLDRRYNFLRYQDFYLGRMQAQDVRILHYIMKKPWEIYYRLSGDGMLTDLDDMWTDCLSDEERRELIALWRRQIFKVSERDRIEGFGAKTIGPLQQQVEQELPAIRKLLMLLLLGAVATIALLLLLLSGDFQS
jgi:Glycosyl transferase family 8